MSLLKISKHQLRMDKVFFFLNFITNIIMIIYSYNFSYLFPF